MDKRSLLFVVCVSLAFFAIQAWFGETPKVTAKNTELPSIEQHSLSLRKADLNSLPLSVLYKDSLGKEKLFCAVETEGYFLVLNEKTSLPEFAYVLKGEKSEKVSLQSKGKTLSLYSSKKESISLPALPRDYRVNLQLVSLEEVPRVSSLELQGYETLFQEEKPQNLSLALLKVQNTYKPVGLYDPVKAELLDFNQIENLKMLVQQPKPVTLVSSSTGEEFYVLENDFQQLVFSTRGGSLAEINLPFKGTDHPESIVKEIDIDREILAQSPENSHFPLNAYYAPDRKGLQEEGSLGGYYPLLRRSILGKNGSPVKEISPEYYALSVFGENSDFAQMNYKVTRFEKNLIEFVASSGRRKVTKTYFIPEEKNGPYCFQLNINVEGSGETLWVYSGVPDVELVGGSYAPLLKYQLPTPSGSEVDTISLPKKEASLALGTNPNWISNNNGFLGLILDPLNRTVNSFKTSQVEGSVFPTRLSLIDAKYNLYPPQNYPGYVAALPLEEGETLFRVFAGPYDETLLKKLDELYDDPLKRYNPEYTQAQSIQGWFSFISQPFSKFLFFLMQLFYSITRSWAASIILLTIALRAMMYPLNSWSIRSTVRMQEIAPKIKATQERYKKDPKKAQMEVVKLYKESGVNPVMGCLPMLLQMPFLIGMFYLLKSSFALRGAMFIPGWIDDLAAPDVLFSWGPPLWFIGNEFHLLPILMGITMFLQQKISAKAKANEPLSDTQKQQKMMGNVMSIFFIVLFYKFPSGLNIYFMFSTLLGILQQWWMSKKLKPAT